MNIFKVSEVVDMGIEKEKKRRDFYGMVAEKFQDDRELNELFVKLRAWEETHVKKFTEIREKLKDHTFESFPGELSEYMNSLVGDKLYRDVSPDSFADNVNSTSAALAYGIAFEKDAILFFRELLPYAGEENKGVISELIEEEKQHLVYLADLKKKITG